MMQPSNVEVTPINRSFLEEQGILKAVGSKLKKKKKVLGLIRKLKTKKR